MLMAGAAVVGSYLALLALVFVAQRTLVFPAPAQAARPSAASTIVELPETILMVRPPPTPGVPVVLHFHGNGSQVADTEWLADEFARQGLGFVAVEYPGYGLAAGKGSPSEDSIVTAALAAVQHVTGTLQLAPKDLVLSGQSLGTGVAVELARRGVGRRMILITPYTSLPDVGARAFPFLPVQLLMRDRFESGDKASSIAMPVLIVHGTADEVVPFELGERLSTLFPHATLMRLEGAHHNDVIDAEGVVQGLIEFVKKP